MRAVLWPFPFVIWFRHLSIFSTDHRWWRQLLIDECEGHVLTLASLRHRNPRKLAVGRDDFVAEAFCGGNGGGISSCTKELVFDVNYQ